jgi:hypothetical protein
MQLPNGTYRGLTWTDESPSVMGEMEVVIDDTSFHMRIATGLELITDSLPRSEVRDITTDEVAAHFNEGSDITDVVGVQVGHDGVVLLRLADPDNLLGLSDEEREESRDAPRVMVLGMTGAEVFGPSLLFTPSQVEAGLFDRCLAGIQAELGRNAVPLIAHNGLRIETPS